MCTGDRLKVMLASMTPRKTSVPLMMGNPSNYALCFTILLNLTYPGPSTYSAHLLSMLILHFFICSARYKLPAYQNNLFCLDCNFYKTGLINYFSLCLLQSSSVSKIKLVWVKGSGQATKWILGNENEDAKKYLCCKKNWLLIILLV